MSFEENNRMSFPRTTVILIACSAVVVVCASFVGVQASSCLSSASAVRQEHPGAWPSWTLRFRGHEGVKCWYPATQTTAHNHRYEVALKKNSVEAPKLQPTLGENRPNGSQSIPLTETNGFGWPLASNAGQIGTTPIPEGSSFTARFAAAIRQDGRRPSLVMQIMIDPIASARVPIVIDAGGDKPAPLEPHMIENKSSEDGNSASGETIRVDPPLAASEDRPSGVRHG